MIPQTPPVTALSGQVLVCISGGPSLAASLFALSPELTTACP
ncbi:hypothetical protein [Thiolapillus sp.]